MTDVTTNKVLTSDSKMTKNKKKITTDHTIPLSHLGFASHLKDW